jgi:hypothetical protein
VFDETSLNTALANIAKVVLAADITLTAPIVIDGLTGVVISGNGFKVYGSNSARCFLIQGQAEVSLFGLTTTKGNASGSGDDFGGGLWIRSETTVTMATCAILATVALWGSDLCIQDLSTMVTMASWGGRELNPKGGANGDTPRTPPRKTAVLLGG